MFSRSLETVYSPALVEWYWNLVTKDALTDSSKGMSICLLWKCYYVGGIESNGDRLNDVQL